jgi:hypothetical protein
MLRDSEVADLEMTFFDQMVSIDRVNIINYHLLPHALQCTDFSIRDWLMSRLNPSHTRHYIDLMPIIFHNGSYRRPYAQLALSLETNGFSLSDHYWFNPKKDMSFCYESRDVHFKRKVWGEINQWSDNIWSTDLNEFLFHDMLFVNYGATRPAFNNPIFTTNGNKEKIWHKNEEKWLLEKRLSDKQLAVEVECLDFFAKHNILVPKFNVVHHDVFNRYQFQPVTVRKGFYTIQKQCIASKDCQLTPLNWYISEDCEYSIHSVIKQAQNALNIEPKTLEIFENAIIEYLATYNYQQVATSNLGFLVDKSNNAVPAAWSCVGYSNANPFII